MTDVVFALLIREGTADYIGEPITQIEHMLEAAQLAFERNYPEFVIAACLFHDIGHLIKGHTYMGHLGVKNHEKIGAEFLKKLGFSQEVYDLVLNHVNAKRYLISINPDYKLSKASAQTLEYQGGKMSKEECDQFEKNPNFKWYLIMRKIDEAAKGNKLATMKLEDFRNICDRVMI